MKKPTRAELRQAIDISLEILSDPHEATALSVRALEAVATSHGPVLVGRDALQQPHLLLAIDADQPELQNPKSAGVSAARRTLVHDGKQQVFVDVACRIQRLSRLFGLLCTDLLERVVDTPDAPEAVVAKTLDEWRAMVAKAQAKLDESRARGLFGELYQLLQLLDISPGAVACWRGPEAAEHDLVGGAYAIEVKSKGRRGNLVEIHGLRQLERPAGGALTLVVQTVESRTGGTSLASMVEAVAERADDRALFVDRLGLLGLSPDDPTLEEFSFEVTDAQMFVVDDEFPRLVPGDLVEGHLHPAIRSLKYVIDLSNASDPMDEAAVRAHREKVVAS